jgi:alcohol dehydrogenase
MMKDLTAGHLAAAGSLNLSHHGLVRAGFQPGMTVLVNGATGSFGSLACLVALGMGASKVVGIGRNKGHLKRIDEKLGAVYGSRFSTAYSAAGNEGDTDDDKLKKLTERLQQSAGKTGNPSTGADICIDLLGQAKTTDSTLACLRSLERGGVLVPEGSMTVPLNLSYMELMLNNLVVMGNVGLASFLRSIKS